MTKTERIILIFLLQILKKLYPNNQEYDFEKMRIVLENGYELQYEMITGHLQEEMTIGECNEVFKILNMYRALKTSYNNLQDKSGINPEDIKFKGFDGNFEAKYLCYVQFIFESLNFFEELKDDSKSLNYDTHFETLNRYRKMLKVWENYNKSCTLDKDQIKSIINQ